MIILQIDSLQTSMNLYTSGNDFWFFIEIAIIIGVIIYQLVHSIIVFNSITELRKIFDFRLEVKNGFIEKEKLGKIEDDSTEIQYEDEFEIESLNEIVGSDIIKLSLVHTKGNNEIIKRIKTTLNTYLINNYGAAVNFSIIKDIIDREVEVKDEEITQTITTPLYFGLAATMIGIIFGLMAMPNLDGDGFTVGVNALIRGVKWAMSASLWGLACTTILSSFFYKNAKSKVLRKKNAQLSYLQAKLLPELIKAEDTGVSGLKASLDRFARVATIISDNVLIAANQTGENLILQQEVMDKIENMEVRKVSKWNLELFDKLDKNMETFNKFSTYLFSMEKISSNLLEFSARTSNIDLVIKQIDSTLNESKKLTQFLSAHFDKIEASGSAALKSVGIAESHFENAIESLKTRTDEMINQLYKSAGNHEIKLGEIYEEIQIGISNITSEYINKFSSAYSDTIPKFEQLDNLAVLPSFKEEFLLKTNDFQIGSNINSQKLIDSITELNDSLKLLQQNLNNQTIINKLDAIDEKLKKRTTKTINHRSVPTISEDIIPEKETTQIEGQTLSLIQLFNKLLSKKSK